MKSAKELKQLVESSLDFKILYVEDDDQLRENTLRLLSTFFKTIDSAVNGQEGFDKYRSDEYDIVISDLRMPVMGGIEMVKNIKNLNDDQMVVITSAHDESQYLLELIGLGVENFILKPLDVEQFLSVLGKTIRYINLKRMEVDYTRKLEATVEKRTKELSTAYEKLEEYSSTLEQKVAMRTAELNQTLKEVEKANTKVMDSIEYAKRIQRSLLPNLAETKSRLPNSFFLWIPRDIVGGDIFCTDFFGDDFIVSVIDCTGHGVPGALMTMIASSGMRRIIRDDNCRDPADILESLNFFIKTSLQQDTDYALSNDGLDAAICYVDPRRRILNYAGARLPLVCICDGEVDVIPADRASIGYRKSDLDFRFKQHALEIKNNTSFYMYTDGFVDQVGGEMHFGFGRRNLENLLRRNFNRSFEEQEDLLLKAFHQYKGDNETRDDVTVVGFSLDPKPETLK
ncbi:MAG: response regulator [Proteobacteria bacterium]|nr:response regulator [Pseudomonadota bacterium]